MTWALCFALCLVGSMVATWRRWPLECTVIIASMLGWMLGG